MADGGLGENTEGFGFGIFFCPRPATSIVNPVKRKATTSSHLTHCFCFNFALKLYESAGSFSQLLKPRACTMNPSQVYFCNCLPGKCAGNALLRACLSQHERAFGSLKTRGQFNMTVVHGFRMVTWIGQQEMSSCVHVSCLPFDC